MNPVREPGRPQSARGGLFLGVLLLIAIGALLLRLPDLGNRPMHGDEAVHAAKFRDLWEKGDYQYDPNEFHGPTLYYAALPSVWLRGRTNFAATRESDFRLVTVVFGGALVLLLGLLFDGLGWQAVLWAGLFTALSPAFVFYSRYYIQEMILAFFTLGCIGCGWRYTRSRHWGWLAAASVSAGLMVASKETSALAFAAAAMALALERMRSRRSSPTPLEPRPGRDLKLIGVAVIPGLLAACFLLSDGFLHPLAPLGYLQSYTPWIHRAHATSIHQHPWHYYLVMLGWTHRATGPIWSEGIILALALLGMFVALSGRTAAGNNAEFLRFLALYTILLTVAYSAIPYKTPWCVLNFEEGLIMLAGVGASQLVELAPRAWLRVVLIVFLLLGAAQLGWQAYRTSYLYPTDGRNPYTYAQPVPDVVELEKHLEALAGAYPAHYQMVIKVLSTDTYYWPLPWYLRRFPNVGYWTTVPGDLDAAVILASPEFDEALSQKLPNHLMTGYRGLRPGVTFEVWVRMDVWKAYLEQKKRAGLSTRPG